MSAPRSTITAVKLDEPLLHAYADLLGDNPVASYDTLDDTATAAVRAGDFAETFRFTYGDYSLARASRT